MIMLRTLAEQIRAIAVLVLAVLPVSLCEVPTATAQRQIPLPIDAPLTTPRLELNLTNARVRVLIVPEQASRFAARLENPEKAEKVSLEVSIVPGGLTDIRGPESADAPTMVIDISLADDQFITLIGRNLDLEILGPDDEVRTDEAAPAEEDRQAPESPQSEDAIQPVITAILTDSRLVTQDLDGLSLTATRGTNEIVAQTGFLELDLRESAARIQGHQGQITLRSLNSDSRFRNLEGSISADLEDGFWKVSETRASITGELSNAEVVLDSISGKTRLSGQESMIRISSTLESQIQISGEDLQIGVSDLGGSLNATLTRGSLDADSVTGRVDLSLDSNVTADIRNVRGDLAAGISGQSEVVIRGIQGHTRIQLTDSDLELGDLKSLELDAQQSSVTGSGIRALTKVAATDSILEFFLADVMGKPRIDLHGATQATIQLPTPCRVIAKLAEESLSDQIRVNDCLLDFDGLAKRNLRPGPDGRQPVVMTATLDESANLRVDGRP
jgi:hypothetical protein